MSRHLIFAGMDSAKTALRVFACLLTRLIVSSDGTTVKKVSENLARTPIQRLKFASGRTTDRDPILRPVSNRGAAGYRMKIEYNPVSVTRVVVSSRWFAELVSFESA